MWCVHEHDLDLIGFDQNQSESHMVGSERSGLLASRGHCPAASQWRLLWQPPFWALLQITNNFGYLKRKKERDSYLKSYFHHVTRFINVGFKLAEDQEAARFFFYSCLFPAGTCYSLYWLLVASMPKKKEWDYLQRSNAATLNWNLHLWCSFESRRK